MRQNRIVLLLLVWICFCNTVKCGGHANKAIYYCYYYYYYYYYYITELVQQYLAAEVNWRQSLVAETTQIIPFVTTPRVGFEFPVLYVQRFSGRALFRVLLHVTESIVFVLYSTFLWLGLVWSCFMSSVLPYLQNLPLSIIHWGK